MIGSRPHILLSMREKWRHKISEPLQTGRRVYSATAATCRCLKMQEVCRTRRP